MSENDLLAATFEHERLIRALLYRLTRNPADVEDLLQETYARLMHKSAREVTNVRGYALRTAFRLAVDWNRARKVIPLELMADIEELEHLSGAAFTQSIVDEHEQTEQLLRAIKRLPVQVRRVFVLSKVYGFTHAEIRQRTRLNRATIERRLTDAVRCLSAIVGSDLSTYGKGQYTHHTGSDS